MNTLVVCLNDIYLLKYSPRAQRLQGSCTNVQILAVHLAKLSLNFGTLSHRRMEWKAPSTATARCCYHKENHHHQVQKLPHTDQIFNAAHSGTYKLAGRRLRESFKGQTSWADNSIGCQDCGAPPNEFRMINHIITLLIDSGSKMYCSFFMKRPWLSIWSTNQPMHQSQSLSLTQLLHIFQVQDLNKSRAIRSWASCSDGRNTICIAKPMLWMKFLNCQGSYSISEIYSHGNNLLSKNS